MIFTYGIDSDLFKKVEKKDILRYFKDKTVVAYDSETSGLDPYTSSLLCFQIGDGEHQFVVSGQKIGEFKEFLTEKELLGHNIKFDLKFLYHQNIYPKRVRDTFLAECVLKCGIKIAKKSLAEVSKNRLGIEMDKSVRTNIEKLGFTKEVIEYSAKDVEHLHEIYAQQKSEIVYNDLQHVLKLEEEFVLALAYIEYCGFTLDRQKWQDRLNHNLELLRQSQNVLNSLVIEQGFTEYKSSQLDMFSSEQPMTLNWSSPKQVVELFKKLKIPTKVVDGGKEKDSVDSRVIEKFSEKNPIVKEYLNYKAIEKDVSTYGDSFLRQINPISGRLHTSFRQVRDTGRLSSGGKNKATGEENINFQNIPSDKETRSCFVAGKGNVLVVADYSGQEQVVLANKSLDPGLLKFYDEGMGDMHSFVASKMYPELEGLTLEEIKKHHAEKRYRAKTAGFAINYGGVGATIAKNNNLSKEEGDFIYDSYFEAFPGLKNYFDKVKKEGLYNGYILMNDVIGRKSFIYYYDEYKTLREECNDTFWTKWKEMKAAYDKESPNPEFLEAKEKVSRMFKMKGNIERMSLNYPIQGTSADITKISAIYFFRWLRENNLFKVVLFANQIHDENVVECPESMAETVKEVLEDCMKRAADLFCKRVSLTADGIITPFWAK